MLFVLPLHCSHILQPLDICCFSPMKAKFNQECQLFMRQNPGRQITRYDICALTCKAYMKGLNANNLISAFKKFGIFPLDKHVIDNEKKVREKSRECHNHKAQPFPDPKRKRKRTNPNKHKPNKRTKSTKISSLFPKRGNRNTKRTEKHKNKMTHGNTYNKSPRRINHKATKSKTNTGTTALERSVEQTTGI